MSRSPKDQAVRTQAIELSGKGGWIEASAGTGKTTLLTDRYIHLVDVQGLSPQDIVAITFTEKAAQELRHRIKAKLESLGKTEAVHAMEFAPIGTIHAFCARILRSFPFSAELDPEFRILTDTSLEAFFDQSFATYMSRSAAEGHARMIRALDLGVSTSRIRDMAWVLYQRRHLLRRMGSTVGQWNPKAIREELNEATQVLKDHVKLGNPKEGDAGLLAIESLNALWEEMSELEGADWERFFLLRLQVPKGKGRKDAWEDPERCRMQKACMSELHEAVANAKEALRSEVLLGLVQALEHFVGEIEGWKRHHSYLDFDDLLHKTHQLVGGNLSVLEQIRRMHKVYLVDEFQDTDPIQKDIVFALLPRLLSEDGPDFSSFFGVGDPKQSIYRFRGADIDAFFQARREGGQALENLVISQNFRTQPKLIDALNSVFHALLPEHHTPLEATEFPTVSPPIWVLKDGAEDKTSSTQACRRREAQAVSDMVEQLLSEKPAVVRSIDGKGLVPPTAGDLAILIPTNTDAGLLEEALRQKQIPYVNEGGRLFFQRLEVRSALNMLGFLMDPQSKADRLASLKSIFIGASDQEIWDLFNGTHKEETAAGTVSWANATLDALAKKRHRKASEALLDIYSSLDVFATSSLRHSSRQVAANLLELHHLAAAMEESEGFDLERFWAWCQMRNQRQAEQKEAMVEETHQNAVRIMTMHKSKGLEFPITILGFMGSSGQTGALAVTDAKTGQLEVGFGPKDARFASAGYESALTREKDALEQERRRLLYVAMTRARDLLIVPKFLPKAELSGLWSLLGPCLDMQSPNVREMVVKPHTPAPEAKVRDDQADLPLFAHVDAKAPEGHGPGETASAVEFAKLVLPRGTMSGFGPKVVQPSTLKTKFAAPEAFQGLDVQDDASGKGQHIQASRRASRFGVAVHEAFEHGIWKEPESDRRRFLKALLTQHGLEGSENEAASMIDGFLKTPLFARLKRSEKVLSEWPFSYHEEGRLMEGSFDLAFWEPDGWILLDFKTDKILNAAHRDHLESVYAPQMEAYQRAFEVVGQTLSESVLVFLRDSQDPLAKD